MKGKVKIEKSFDNTRDFSKDLENGDFEEFFQEEGKYLDKLVSVAKEHGNSGDTFTVIYTVTVEA